MVIKIRKRILVADDNAALGNEIQKVMQNDYIEVNSISASLSEHEPGDTVNIAVVRDGKLLTAEITLSRNAN